MLDVRIAAAVLIALSGGACQRPLSGPAAPAGPAQAKVVSGCSPAGPLTAPGALPANLAAPGDARLFLRLRAEGTQIYRCQKNPAGAWAFTLKAPDARLISDGCTEVGRHVAGPTWALTDGSAVVGKKLAEAPRAGTIPWLLLSGTPSGSGGMTEARFIQRVNTTGGTAPVEGCDEASAGREVAIPYTATYLYYRPSTSHAAAVSNSRS
jgi:hypothetical protein